MKKKESANLKLSPVFNWVFIVVSLLLSFLSKNSFLFLTGMAVLCILFYFFFVKSVPPVLLFGAFFGWFFFQGQLIDALIKGKDLVYLDTISTTRPVVVLLGMVATLSFFLGIYSVVYSIIPPTLDSIKAFFLRINLTRLLWIYLTVYIILFFAGKIIWLVPGFSQPLFVLSQFRWAVFFLLFATVFTQNRLKGILLILILIDVLLGFFSFFSSFKEPIYFSFIAYWIFFFRQPWRVKFLAFIFIYAVFYFGAYWTAVKKDYRSYLNKGSGAQEVRVSREEAYSKLVALMSSVNEKELDKGLDELLTRLSWIGALDAVYNHVPSKVSYEEGALWWEGISRPFMPRLFFSEKKILTDSKELNRYSGLGVDEKNTSISLSMVAGSYVDFGAWGMHVPLFLFGIFCGWVYKKVVNWGVYPMIGYALTMPMIYLLSINEQSINRIVSAMVLYFVLVWIIKTFLLRSFVRYIFT